MILGCLQEGIFSLGVTGTWLNPFWFSGACYWYLSFWQSSSECPITPRRPHPPDTPQPTSPQHCPRLPWPLSVSPPGVPSPWGAHSKHFLLASSRLRDHLPGEACCLGQLCAKANHRTRHPNNRYLLLPSSESETQAQAGLVLLWPLSRHVDDHPLPMSSHGHLSACLCPDLFFW